MIPSVLVGLFVPKNMRVSGWHYAQVVMGSVSSPFALIESFVIVQSHQRSLWVLLFELSEVCVAKVELMNNMAYV